MDLASFSGTQVGGFTPSTCEVDWIAWQLQGSYLPSFRLATASPPRGTAARALACGRRVLVPGVSRPGGSAGVIACPSSRSAAQLHESGSRVPVAPWRNNST